ncbi:C4-dicarboxylate TRAP transporter substrate-binding protein [Salipiger sp.]|uniref:C4-dicarboxylate TRAP transporter substrate-binding protein n=1 Tax=Salipiger sp. TaxID=2078585 RepID=UPI003A974836
MKFWRTIALSASVGIAAGGSVAAEDYRAATFTPASENHARSMQWLADDLKAVTDGEISFELFVGGALIPAKSIMQGVADGVAQMGFVFTGYLPSDLPISNALTGMAFVETDPIVLALAYADYIMNDEAGFAEFFDNGVIPVGGIGSAPSDFLCNTAPITSLDELKGKRIRVPGGLVSQLVQDLGAIPVAIPSSEMYQALQGGQVDCVANSPSHLNIDGSLQEVSKSVLRMNMSPAFASPTVVYDADFWQGLTPENRRVLLDAGAGQLARLEVGYLSPIGDSLRMAEDKGIVVIDPDQTIEDAVAAWVANGVGGMAANARDTLGIEDPDALFATFSEYLDKWRPIVAGLNDRLDEEELTALIKTNLMDKIDVTTFGMN